MIRYRGSMTCESNDTVHLCVDVCVIYESLFYPQLTYSWWSIRKPSKILARYINWVDDTLKFI